MTSVLTATPSVARRAGGPSSAVPDPTAAFSGTRVEGRVHHCARPFGSTVWIALVVTEGVDQADPRENPLGSTRRQITRQVKERTHTPQRGQPPADLNPKAKEGTPRE